MIELRRFATYALCLQLVNWRYIVNIKSFALGFSAMDSVIAGVSACKRRITNAAKSTVHGAQSSVRMTKSGVLNTSEVVTSFFAGMRQAIKCRRGECRMLGNER